MNIFDNIGKDNEQKPSVIKSVQNSDQDILLSIKKLYLNDDNFDLDPCFSKGVFYKNMITPRILYDKVPVTDNVIENDIINGLPLDDKSIKSVIFDPPFMFGNHGKTSENKMTKRFSMFDKWDDLEVMYKKSLSEFYRVLEKGGIVAFKCQDYTDSKTTLTHCYVHNWALEEGFKVEDLFILHFTKGRIWNSKLKQRHARKFHSYWFVFKK